MNEVESLLQTVVDGGFCVGCGACAAVADDVLQIVMSSQGMYTARLREDVDHLSGSTKVLQVCPFSGLGPDEEEIAAKLFGTSCEYFDGIGYCLRSYAGFVREGSFRANGSSGGLGTWLAHELLIGGHVDRVIHVKSCSTAHGAGVLFRMAVSSSPEEVLDGAKSRYYPVEMSAALKEVKATAARYAIVGLPCFIKAVRLLANCDEQFRQGIHVCISLVCGHLKSTCFADMLAWQMGIAPGTLEQIDFRRKQPHGTADRYAVAARGRGGNRQTECCPAAELFGTNWGHGFFRVPACDYCDDVFGETADISIGDAWLPDYIDDPEGTNILVVRNPAIADLLDSARQQGRLELQDISPTTAVSSQAGGLRHRREGLAYRLHLKDALKAWRPAKRVGPDPMDRDSARRKTYDLRLKVAGASHASWQEAINRGDFGYFISAMSSVVEELDSHSRKCRSLRARLTGVLPPWLKKSLRRLFYNWLRKARRRFR